MAATDPVILDLKGERQGVSPPSMFFTFCHVLTFKSEV